MVVPRSFETFGLKACFEGYFQAPHMQRSSSGWHKRCLDIFSIQGKCVPIAVGVMIGVGVGIGIGKEGQKAGFGHTKPDVSRTSIAYVGWPIVTVREDQPQYTVGIDPDPDSDPDTDGNQERTDRQQPAQAAAKPRLSQTMKKCPNPTCCCATLATRRQCHPPPTGSCIPGAMQGYFGASTRSRTNHASNAIAMAYFPAALTPHPGFGILGFG
jgi:hypothetical protein